MLKIFINMVMWKKIKNKTDLIQICCYLCDISLMADNDDVNMMAVFCLAQTSENEESHRCIFVTVKTPFSGDETPAMRHVLKQKQNSIHSIFSRLNFLMQRYLAIDYKGHPDA
jgi:hypothetical protein